MRQVLLAIMLWLAPSAALASDPNDCLAAPSQSCVFDLAIEMVEAEDHPPTWARTLLTIALLQEEAGDEGSSATLRHFLATADSRGDRGIRSTISFIYGTLGISPIGRSVEAPTAHHALADHLLFFYDQRPEFGDWIAPSSVSGVYARAGDIERAFDFLETFPAEIRNRGMGGLAFVAATEQNWSALDRLRSLATTERARDGINWQAAYALLRIAEYDHALETILAIEDLNRRIGLLASLAEHLADAGHEVETRALIQRLLQTGNLDQSAAIARRMATIYAEMGDEDAMRSVLVPVANNHPDELEEMLDDLYITLEFSNGNPVTALQRAFADFTPLTEDQTVVHRVEWAATLLIEADVFDLDMMLDHVPFTHTSEGLFAILTALVRAERFDDALPIIDELERRGFEADPSQRWVHLRFEEHLAAQGNATDAINRAYIRGDAFSLAVLATLID